MIYIRKDGDRWLKYTAPRPIHGGNFLHLPESLEAEFTRLTPNVKVTSADGVVTAVEKDTDVPYTSMPSIEERIAQLEQDNETLLYLSLLNK